MIEITLQNRHDLLRLEELKNDERRMLQSILDDIDCKAVLPMGYLLGKDLGKTVLCCPHLVLITDQIKLFHQSIHFLSRNNLGDIRAVFPSFRLNEQKPT